MILLQSFILNFIKIIDYTISKLVYKQIAFFKLSDLRFYKSDSLPI